MKKITLLTAFLISFVGFSQANRQKIQDYLDANRGKFELNSNDISDWIIESEGSSSSTKITNYRIVQRYQGIELFDAQSNVWVKNEEVINIGNRFRNNIAQRVNTKTPSLSVLQAIEKAYAKLEITNPATFTIVETVTDKKFKISDGIQEDFITAKLVYQSTLDKKLKLAWGFQFYSPDGKHLWDLRIDAIDGQLLEKNDLVISCAFGNPNHNDHNHTKIDLFSKSFFKNSSVLTQVNGGSYRVIPYNYTSPNHSPFQLVASPENALASPNGWHNANSATGTNSSLIFTISRGNNTFVKEDSNGDNEGPTSGPTPFLTAQGGSSLNFDFPYTGQTSQPTAYTSASITNLFYMNNIMHDVWYQYGFDEVNANFQQNNLGRGGVTSALGDAVLGDAQDGYAQTTPTLNNANFASPADGSRPRMQMFMWNSGAPPTNYIQVNSPASLAGPKVATTNVFFGTDRIAVPEAPNGITADLVLVTNVPTNPLNSVNSACNVPTNAAQIAGKIALIKRGGCSFASKVKKAQDAGALAVVMMDSVANNPTRLSMSSAAPLLGITIPAIFVTKEIGDAFIAELVNGPVNIKIEVPAGLYLYADGSFDNTIIAHEYGHGISNRLVGNGAAGCMNNYDQMGEGWSDWFALMMQMKAGDVKTTGIPVGTYAINQPNTGAGIRDFPYSTDMGINPRTLNSTNTPVPPIGSTDTSYRYKQGEFWTSVLWDLAWAYVEKYGYDGNIYTGTGGNNKVMRLVIDALKLDVCNGTTVVAGRNNLFAAEQATTGGIDYCMIAEVFRRRGVGLNASSGDANVCSDQVEDFTAFPAGPNCVLGVSYFKNDDMVSIYPNPSNGEINIKINQYNGKVNLQVVDLNGRVVYSLNNTDFNVEKAINLKSLQSGMYIVKINGEELNYTKKIILN